MSETPRLHQSIASVLINRSPLHAWYKAFRKEEEEWDEAKSRGQLCHKLLLGGRDIVAVEANDWRTNAAKEQRDQAIFDSKIPVLAQKLAIAHALKEKVLAELTTRGINLTGECEKTVQWATPGGVLCEGTLDHWIQRSATIYDFKFVTTAVKKSCEASFLNYGYDIQHAAYVQAMGTLFPELAGRIKMLFIFVEVDSPHAMRVMPVGGTMRKSGEWRWGTACDRWRVLLEEYGIERPWPAYADDNEEAECPVWALNAQLAEAEFMERQESNVA